MRVDLQHREAAVGQLAVAKLGQRAAAQPDHDNVGGSLLQQQKTHHGAGVVHVELPGAGLVHPALQFAHGEMQRLGAAVIAHKGLDMGLGLRREVGGQRGGKAGPRHA